MWHFNREEQTVSLSSNIIHRVIVPFCMNDGWGGGGGGIWGHPQPPPPPNKLNGGKRELGDEILIIFFIA